MNYAFNLPLILVAKQCIRLCALIINSLLSAAGDQNFNAIPQELTPIWLHMEYKMKCHNKMQCHTAVGRRMLYATDLAA
ncbi:MAG: hypothetical protein EOO61_09775 [Hymenobacter sp.]|nr:MAG: hypothetical protein EOO61_09775 [Hymenobacter sp.]